MEQVLEISTKLYEANRTLRQLLGNEKYEAHAKLYIQALKQRMTKFKIPTIKAVLHMVKELKMAVPDPVDRDVSTTWILAAAVDIIEGFPKTQNIRNHKKRLTTGVAQNF